ncbi:EAL domain-containing protein [Novosphingobium sp. G106]|uniref:sensor domain-containing protein n=1 Tax=Novosphingobium sp. G106 TaxID=2849500 RepID=UPI001C2D4C48|nr:EAL domain-containing protein [Novosphingobium sp. G106]MBV1692321.1 EAL domain-containing protein [Novosphingobium sp. G106]
MQLPGSAELNAWIDCAEPAGLEELERLGITNFLISALEDVKLGTWRLDRLTGIATWDTVTSVIVGAEAVPVTSGALLPVHEDDREWLAASIGRSFEEGTNYDAEFRAVGTDGDIRWQRSLARPLSASEGEESFLAGIVFDVTGRKRAQGALAESKRQLRAIIDALPGIVYRWEIQPPWQMSLVSEAAISLTGYSRRHFAMGLISWEDVIHPEDRHRAIATVARSVASKIPYSLRYRIVRRTGEIRWVEERGKAAYNEGGKPLCLEGFIGDVHDHVLAEQRIRETEERYRLATKATMDLIWDWDLVSDQLIWNEALHTCFGYKAEMGSTGRWWQDRIHPDDRDRIVADVEEFFRSGSSQYVGEYRFQRADGSYAEIYYRGYLLRDHAGAAVRMVGAMQDLSERKSTERQLVWAATRDPLTHLPNRSLFQQSLQEALQASKLEDVQLAVLLLDLDDFKQVNDTLGHDAGDALLRTFAARLTDCVSDQDLVARLGGDEFALILHDVIDEQQLKLRAKLILKTLKQPFVHDGSILDFRVSIGSALFPAHGCEPQELLKHADIALNVAKGSHRGDLVVFESQHRADLQKRLSMVAAARRAVRTDQIIPYYQPKVRLKDECIYGFEALLRWKHGRDGAVHLPGSIAAAFDDLEVACEISERMIDRVINDVRGWMDRGISFGHVAINASAAEFRGDQFGERLLDRLQAAKVPTSKIQLEVTETVFLGRGAECVERALKLLSEEGIRIALDDFGTGYASLRHLKQFPVDVIKIDQSFVGGMVSGGGDAAIVEAVVNLGRSLDIEVVAEGIESKLQEAVLLSLGCIYGQGFLYSKALPASGVIDLAQFTSAPKVSFDKMSTCPLGKAR